MLVSIGMPIYNREKEFERALLSVLSQTYTDWEIIISNDCSPNAAIDRIARKYEALDSRIKYYYQKKSLRTVENFSFVKNQASGKYFLWLADDDWIEPNYIECCVAFLEQNPTYTIACGKCTYHKNEKEILHDNTNKSIEQKSLWIRAIDYFSSVTINGYFYGVLRTASIKKVTLPNELGFDWVAIGHLCLEGKIKAIEETRHHLSKGGMSNEGGELSSYFSKKSFISTHFIGLSTALNCSKSILSCNNISISFAARLLLSCIVFISTYVNTWKWDFILLKRKIIKALGINKDGILIANRKK